MYWLAVMVKLGQVSQAEAGYIILKLERENKGRA